MPCIHQHTAYLPISITTLPALLLRLLSTLQGMFFHPCDWFDKECHTKLLIDRALSRINFTQCVLSLAPHVLTESACMQPEAYAFLHVGTCTVHAACC